MNENLSIQEILQWYILSGVDATCSDAFQPLIKPLETPQNLLRPATTNLAQDFIASKQNARDICTKAKTLAELKNIVENFDGCALKLTAKSTVFGSGNEKAKLMFIGEAPGADEDRCGIPFVGKCGRLLDKMLTSIGIRRDDVYITNIVLWRPPGNRTPTDSEIAICLPFIKKQIELIKPQMIVFLGGSSANALLDNTEPISKLRGKWLEYPLSKKEFIPAMATFHPSYLLRNPSAKSKVWSDFLRIYKKLKKN